MFGVLSCRLCPEGIYDKLSSFYASHGRFEYTQFYLTLTNCDMKGSFFGSTDCGPPSGPPMSLPRPFTDAGSEANTLACV